MKGSEILAREARYIKSFNRNGSRYRIFDLRQKSRGGAASCVATASPPIVVEKGQVLGHVTE